MIDQEESPISFLQNQRKEALDLALQIERKICIALWEVKRTTTIDQILLWTGWSRQTLYNKWRRHGFRIKDSDDIN